MNWPTVSVVIPAFNLANYLPLAIESALNQTYQPLEVIVVDDASTDTTAEVAARYGGAVTCLVHRTNRYAAAARNTAIRASSGDLIAFLDGDDVYHPEKLERQVAFLADNPRVGLTFNSRLEIDVDGRPLGALFAPARATLSDLVMGFPFAPSEVVMRREWAFRVGLFDETLRYHGEDPDFHARLALAGCEMVGVDHILNYRRLNAKRRVQNLDRVVEEELRCQERTFSDHRCRPEVRALRSAAAAELMVNWAWVSFGQGNAAFAQELLERAGRADAGHARRRQIDAPQSLLMHALRVGGDHDQWLREIWPKLPPAWRRDELTLERLVANGHALTAIRNIVWRDSDCLERARAMSRAADLDAAALTGIQAQILACYDLRGREAAAKALRGVVELLSVTKSRRRREFAAKCAMNLMFRDHRAGDHSQALDNFCQSVRYHPAALASRHMVTMACRSIWSLATRKPSARQQNTSAARRLP